jgi:predicted PurR-regulated permease PerM
VHWGERHFGRAPRGLVVGLAFAVVLGVIAAALALFGAQVSVQAESLARDLPGLLDPAVLARRLPLPAWVEPFRDRLAVLLREVFAAPHGTVLPAAQRLGANLLGAAGYLAYVVAVPIFSFLMVRMAPACRARFARGTPGAWLGVADEMNRLLAAYVRALALLSLATLVAYGTVLSLLGVPFALLLAALACLLEVVPVAGPAVGALAILLVALFSGYAHVWWLAVFFTAYRLFQDYMLNPWLMSEGVDVPAILVIFGLFAGEELGGVAGIFLSVPAMAAARILVAHLLAQRAPAR